MKLDEIVTAPVDDDSDAVRLYAAFLREQDASEEYQRARVRVDPERKRNLCEAIRDITGSSGIAPGSGDRVMEWKVAVPWLGIHPEDDLYQAFYALA